MYHVIFNPVAGKKKSIKNLRVVERILTERGLAYELHQSCDVHDAEAIAKNLTEAGETEFIVLGGDGTILWVVEFANRNNIPILYYT